MNPTLPIPTLDRATVDFALRIAPDRCPDPNDTEREIWMKAGAHRLAVTLSNHLTKQDQYVPNP